MIENRYDIFWSIYVNGNNPSKARRTQLPEIEKRIGLVPEKWVSEVEDYNPDMVRFFGMVTLDAMEKQEPALWALERISRLSGAGWTIQGLSTIHDPHYGLYLMAITNKKKHFPAITSAMMEMEQIGSRTAKVLDNA